MKFTNNIAEDIATIRKRLEQIAEEDLDVASEPADKTITYKDGPYTITREQVHYNAGGRTIFKYKINLSNNHFFFVRTTDGNFTNVTEYTVGEDAANSENWYRDWSTKGANGKSGKFLSIQPEALDRTRERYAYTIEYEPNRVDLLGGYNSQVGLEYNGERYSRAELEKLLKDQFKKNGPPPELANPLLILPSKPNLVVPK